MKKVFSSHNEVCHVWASQSQQIGKASNIFFEGDTIYSYGYHYKMAKIYPDKICLINSDSYSSSTSKHLCRTRSAVSHMTTFHVPNVDDPKASENIQYLEQLVWSEFTQLVTCNKTYEDSFKGSCIEDRLNEYINYCKTFNIKCNLKIDNHLTELIDEIILYKKQRQEDRAKCPKLAAKRLKAQENRTKAQEEEREARRLKQIERDKQRQLEAIKDLVRIKNWKQGKNNISSFNSDCIFLRVKGELVETSQGANVPLDDAIKFVKLVKRSKVKKGSYVGIYEFNSFENDTLEIGCHNIEMKEVNRVLGKYLTDLKVVV